MLAPGLASPFSPQHPRSKDRFSLNKGPGWSDMLDSLAFPLADPPASPARKDLPRMALINVTEDASAQIKRLLDAEGKMETHALRMKVVGGGCSGLHYQLAFDDSEKEGDVEIESNGVRVVVDEKSALYLVGTALDYVDSLMESGFKIENPNAKTTCGCGQSFGA